MTERATVGPRGRQRGRALVRTVTGVVGLGLIMLLIARIGIVDVITAARRIGPVALIGAAGVATLGLLLSSIELRLVYRSAGAHVVPQRALVHEVAEVVLLNAVVPFGGSARRAALARVRRDASVSRFITGLSAQVLLVIAVALALVAAAALSAPPGLVVGGIVPVLVLAAWRGIGPHRGSAPVGLDRSTALPALLVGLVPLATLRVLLVAGRLWVLAAALGGGGALVPQLGVGGLAVASMALPLVPGGLGLREALISSTATWLALTVPGALAVALVDRAVALGASLALLVVAREGGRRGSLEHGREGLAQSC